MENEETDDEDPSQQRLFKESEDEQEAALAVSESNGHDDEATMTGLIPESPLESLFQAGFFSALPWNISELSDFSFSVIFVGEAEYTDGICTKRAVVSEAKDIVSSQCRAKVFGGPRRVKKNLHNIFFLKIVLFIFELYKIFFFVKTYKHNTKKF